MKLALPAAKVGVGMLAVLALIQVVRPSRSNPPVTADLQAPPEVKDVLRRACYDCHSNETRWPWYSHVAPVSWLLSHDVQDGREELNFSAWGSLSAPEQEEQRGKIAESIAEGDMPPWYYVPMHPDARLSATDRSLLNAWAGPDRGAHR